MVSGWTPCAKATGDNKSRANRIFGMKRDSTFIERLLPNRVSMSRLLLTLWFVSVSRLCAQDPREIVRKSVQMDQANWFRMKNYTCVSRLLERHLNSHGQANTQTNHHL